MTDFASLPPGPYQVSADVTLVRSAEPTSWAILRFASGSKCFPASVIEVPTDTPGLTVTPAGETPEPSAEPAPARSGGAAAELVALASDLIAQRERLVVASCYTAADAYDNVIGRVEARAVELRAATPLAKTETARQVAAEKLARLPELFKPIGHCAEAWGIGAGNNPRTWTGDRHAPHEWTGSAGVQAWCPGWPKPDTLQEEGPAMPDAQAASANVAAAVLAYAGTLVSEDLPGIAARLRQIVAQAAHVPAEWETIAAAAVRVGDDIEVTREWDGGRCIASGVVKMLYLDRDPQVVDLGDPEDGHYLSGDYCGTITIRRRVSTPMPEPAAPAVYRHAGHLVSRPVTAHGPDCWLVFDGPHDSPGRWHTWPGVLALGPGDPQPVDLGDGAR